MEEQKYYYGTGKRKSAIARVRLVPGEGTIIVNNMPYEERFPRPKHRQESSNRCWLRRTWVSITCWLRWRGVASPGRRGLSRMVSRGRCLRLTSG